MKAKNIVFYGGWYKMSEMWLVFQMGIVRQSAPDLYQWKCVRWIYNVNNNGRKPFFTPDDEEDELYRIA